MTKKRAVAIKQLIGLFVRYPRARIVASHFSLSPNGWADFARAVYHADCNTIEIIFE